MASIGSRSWNLVQEAILDDGVVSFGSKENPDAKTGRLRGKHIKYNLKQLSLEERQDLRDLLRRNTPKASSEAKPISHEREIELFDKVFTKQKVAKESESLESESFVDSAKKKFVSIGLGIANLFGRRISSKDLIKEIECLRNSGNKFSAVKAPTTDSPRTESSLLDDGEDTDLLLELSSKDPQTILLQKANARADSMYNAEIEKIDTIITMFDSNISSASRTISSDGAVSVSTRLGYKQILLILSGSLRNILTPCQDLYDNLSGRLSTERTSMIENLNKLKHQVNEDFKNSKIGAKKTTELLNSLNTIIEHLNQIDLNLCVTGSKYEKKAIAMLQQDQAVLTDLINAIKDRVIPSLQKNRRELIVKKQEAAKAFFDSYKKIELEKQIMKNKAELSKVRDQIDESLETESRSSNKLSFSKGEEKLLQSCLKEAPDFSKVREKIYARIGSLDPVKDSGKITFYRNLLTYLNLIDALEKKKPSVYNLSKKALTEELKKKRLELVAGLRASGSKVMKGFENADLSDKEIRKKYISELKKLFKDYLNPLMTNLESKEASSSSSSEEVTVVPLRELKKRRTELEEKISTLKAESQSLSSVYELGDDGKKIEEGQFRNLEILMNAEDI